MRPSVRSNLNENHMLGLEGRHDPIVLPKVGYDILSLNWVIMFRVESDNGICLNYLWHYDQV